MSGHLSPPAGDPCQTSPVLTPSEGLPGWDLFHVDPCGETPIRTPGHSAYAPIHGSAAAASTALAISFIDCINRRDVDGLGELMAEDHQLKVFEEPPLTGRRENIEAWSGYVRSFPDYVIHPHRLAQSDRGVAVLGHTTGSHLGSSNEEEQELTLIWIAEITDGRVRVWRLQEDSLENRRATCLDQV